MGRGGGDGILYGSEPRSQSEAAMRTVLESYDLQEWNHYRQDEHWLPIALLLRRLQEMDAEALYSLAEGRDERTAREAEELHEASERAASIVLKDSQLAELYEAASNSIALPQLNPGLTGRDRPAEDSIQQEMMDVIVAELARAHGLELFDHELICKLWNAFDLDIPGD